MADDAFGAEQGDYCESADEEGREGGREGGEREGSKGSRDRQYEFKSEFMTGMEVKGKGRGETMGGITP